VFELLPYLFLVPCAPCDLVFLFLDRTVDGLQLSFLVKEHPLLALLFELEDLTFELGQRVLGNETADFPLAAAIPLLLLRALPCRHLQVDGADSW